MVCLKGFYQLWRMDINIFFRVFTLVALYDYRQKRVRFPKGKKIKSGDEVVDVGPHTEDSPSEVKDPHLAAKERALRRTQITAKLLEEENAGMLHDISAAEEHYEVYVFTLLSSFFFQELFVNAFLYLAVLGLDPISKFYSRIIATRGTLEI